ncbi:MAG: polyamine ABC transporter substrate-binding protein [Rhodomicrobium sp.]|nr:polyamine ABC transporter substrate-binding protein [Rhodomicrobium sp.]
MRKIVWCVLIAINAVFHAPDAQAKPDLIIGVGSSDAGRLDPHLSPAYSDKQIFQLLFNGLVRIRPGTADIRHIEPDLAESWTSSGDGKVWTFKLRKGVQCHYGYGELTAEDVVYSLQRAAEPKRSSFSANFTVFEKIEAVDPYTVRIRLKNAVPSLLGLLINYHGGNIVCKKAAEEMGETFQRKPVGTGPFMFSEYRAQQFTRLIAHKDYFRGRPKLDSVTVRYIPSDASRDLAFQAREIDIVYGKQDETWLERMKRLPDTVAVAMEPAELTNIYLNVTAPPLDDIRTRQAFAHAIDRAAIHKLRGLNTNRLPRSVVPIGNLGFDDATPLLDYDPEKAKAQLAEAGHKDGVTLKAIQSTLQTIMSTLEAAQAQLKRADIDLVIEPVDHATYHSQIRKDLSPVVLYQAARFPVADVYLTQFFHSRSAVGTPAGVTNFSHCNAADAEIDQARAETDPDKRKALWAEAQRKIIEAVCAVPVIENLQLWAYSADVDLGCELTGSLNLSIPITEKTFVRD